MPAAWLIVPSIDLPWAPARAAPPSARAPAALLHTYTPATAPRSAARRYGGRSTVGHEHGGTSPACAASTCPHPRCPTWCNCVSLPTAASSPAGYRVTAGCWLLRSAIPLACGRQWLPRASAATGQAGATVSSPPAGPVPQCCDLARPPPQRFLLSCCLCYCSSTPWC
jgi:hypothetical protein